MRASLDTDFFSSPLPRVFGHRGASGTHPENTMVSFQAAFDLGVLYLETDIHMTRDGEIVTSHEPDLELVSGKPGVIKDMDYADIAKHDAGYTFSPNGKDFPFRAKGIRVPRLAEVLTAFPKAIFNIDFKPEDVSLTEKAIKVIDAAKMRRRVMLASEFQNRLDEIRALAPGAPTVLGMQEGAAFLQAMAANDDSYRPPGEALQIPTEYYSFKLATPEFLAFAHRHGLEVHYWTINEEAEMRSLLELGADGIIGDFPELTFKVVASRR